MSEIYLYMFSTNIFQMFFLKHFFVSDWLSAKKSEQNPSVYSNMVSQLIQANLIMF